MKQLFSEQKKVLMRQEDLGMTLKIVNCAQDWAKAEEWTAVLKAETFYDLISK